MALAAACISIVQHTSHQQMMANRHAHPTGISTPLYAFPLNTADIQHHVNTLMARVQSMLLGLNPDLHAPGLLLETECPVMFPDDADLSSLSFACSIT